jgi:transposase
MALTRKQLAVIPILMSTLTNKEAAKVSGISLRTLQRWLAEDEEFKAELLKAEKQTIIQNSRSLIGSQEKAISVMIAVLDSPTSTDADRLKAARLLFEISTRLLEARDIEQRLSKEGVVIRVVREDKRRSISDE